MSGESADYGTVGIVKAKVIRADGSVVDYGVIAGPPLQVIKSKYKRRVVKLWRQLLGLLQQGEK